MSLWIVYAVLIAKVCVAIKVNATIELLSFSTSFDCHPNNQEQCPTFKVYTFVKKDDYEEDVIVREATRTIRLVALRGKYEFDMGYTKGEEEICVLDRNPWLAKMSHCHRDQYECPNSDWKFLLHLNSIHRPHGKLCDHTSAPSSILQTCDTAVQADLDTDNTIYFLICAYSPNVMGNRIALAAIRLRNSSHENMNFTSEKRYKTTTFTGDITFPTHTTTRPETTADTTASNPSTSALINHTTTETTNQVGNYTVNMNSTAALEEGNYTTTEATRQVENNTATQAEGNHTTTTDIVPTHQVLNNTTVTSPATHEEGNQTITTENPVRYPELNVSTTAQVSTTHDVGNYTTTGITPTTYGAATTADTPATQHESPHTSIQSPVTHRGTKLTSTTDRPTTNAQYTIDDVAIIGISVGGGLFALSICLIILSVCICRQLQVRRRQSQDGLQLYDNGGPWHRDERRQATYLSSSNVPHLENHRGHTMHENEYYIPRPRLEAPSESLRPADLTDLFQQQPGTNSVSNGGDDPSNHVYDHLHSKGSDLDY